MKVLPDPSEQLACAVADAVGNSTQEESPSQWTVRDQVGGNRVLERLIAEQSHLMYRIAFAVTRNATDAEDVVQETFLSVLRSSADRFANGTITDERSYLARIAWRLAARHRKRPAAGESEELLERLADAGGTPEETAIKWDLETWLRRSIDRLPEKLRRPLALSALGELSSPEIAAILGVPEGTVRRRIHTARKLLRRRWEDAKGGNP